MRRRLFSLFIILLSCVCFTTAWAQDTGQARTNRVLSLDGDGDYVEIADSEILNDIGSQVTIEVWIKPTGFPQPWISIISKVDEYPSSDTAFTNRSYLLQLNNSGFIHLSSAPSGQVFMELQTVNGLILLNTWYHIAGVIDATNRVMRLFVNGLEVESGNFGQDIHVSELPLTIGKSHLHESIKLYFQGQIDEVRIWNIARSQEEIRNTMHRTLSGQETGLAGYWRFDGSGSVATDSSPNHIHGKLAGDARFVEAELPDPGELIMPGVLTGVVVDESGRPIPSASVRLERDETEIARVETDTSGKYRITVIDHARGLYDLSAWKNDLGAWRTGIRLASGKQTANLALKSAISISGTLLMLDNVTPHAAVPVQAIRNGKVVATVLSDDAGGYKLLNLRPGSYQVRCQVLNGYVYYVENGNGRKWEYEEFGKAATSSHGDFLQVERGRTLQDTNFRFAPFKKGNWRNYTYTDGLADPIISSICCFSNGEVWLGTGDYVTGGSGIFRYDGKGFTRLTKEDGLADNYVTAIHPDPDGGIWLGTASGVSYYDGREFTNFTEKDGLVNNTINAIDSDHDGDIWFGTSSGVSKYDGKEFINFTAEDRLVHDQVSSICCDLDGDIWFGTDGGVSRYDGRGFVNFTAKDGLANNNVNAISCDLDGILWFGTEGGVSRYDGKDFVNLTTRDGLIHNNVQAICCAPDGVLWFGAYAGAYSVVSAGVSRYDGKTFVNFTTEDGLLYNSVTNIQIGADGSIWFANYGGFGGGGVSRYDEKTFANFTMEDGLLHNRVFNIHLAGDGMLWVGTQDGVSRYNGKQFFSFPKPRAQIKNIGSDPDGTIWLGTELGGFSYNGTEFVHFMDGNVTIIHRDPDDVMWVGLWGDGVYRYEGEGSIHFTQEDGLASNAIIMGDPIDSDPDGTVWIGTWTGGVSRYDGAKFLKPLTKEDGLVDNRVTSVCCTDEGVVWFGTANGVSRYDGRRFVNFTYGDGLAGILVFDIHSDSDGITWFGGYGGVSLYDGNAWSSLDAQDGLTGGEVWSIEPDPEGFLWFGTGGGLTRYKRNTTPPWVHIVSVTTDQTYTDISTIPAFNTGTRVTVEYDSIDLKTIPDKRQYQCRIKGIDTDWRKPTKSTLFNHTFERPGSYTFEVQAIDRDLIYSEPASLKLVVVLPFYMKASFLVPTMGSAVVLLLITIASATAYIRHRKQVRSYEREAVEELRDAHEMQMALLPEASSPVEGMEIAGRSIPANTVGGDFFDYLELPDGKVGIAIADVSGKGLRAAMNATMTNGMMHEVATIEASCGRILSRLNAHLYPLMEKQMFTAFSLAILDQDAGVIQWSNAGQPLPMIKRSDGASEADGEGELPLGMMPDVAYQNWELRLQIGDLVIFYTDGIIEAENETEEMYGTERLEKALSGIDSAMSSNEIIDAILKDVTDFTGSAEQYDDMTIVVIKKL